MNAMTTHNAEAASVELFAATAPGWQRWDPQMVAATRPSSDALLAAVGIAPGMNVLDVACGAGEPALRIATLVGSLGRVTASDVNPAMLAAVEEKARREGVTNITLQAADAADLPFDDASFDAITCRMGIMFFARGTAAAELRRVLRPGGRAGFVVWGPYEQSPWLTAIREPVLERSRVEPGANAPDPCRYAEPGTLTAELDAAGFRDVREQARRLVWSFAGTPEQFWYCQSEIGGGYSLPGWDTLSAAQQEDAKRESVRLLRPYARDGYLDIPVAVNVVTALR
jgi:ubiquinone/menaquinone biosynthesis C-methylase UbiE